MPSRPTRRKIRWIGGKPYTSRGVRTVWEEYLETYCRNTKGAGCLPYGNNKLPNAEFTIYNEAGKEVVKGKQTIKESLNLKSYHLENTHIKKLLHQKVMY